MAVARSRGNTQLRERPDSPEWDFTNQKVTCTHVYEGKYADLLSGRPNIDDVIPGYDGLPVVSIKIKRRVSGFAAMTVVTEIEITDAQPQYEIDWTGLEKPVEQHPLFASLFPDPAGVQQWTDDQNTAYNNFTYWETASDPTTKAANYKKLTGGFQQLAQLKMRGTTSYIVPAPVARITTLTLSVAQVGACGSLVSQVPDFPGLPAGYQWLGTADRSTRTGRWGKWQRVTEYTGGQTIDTILYSGSSSSAASSSDS